METVKLGTMTKIHSEILGFLADFYGTKWAFQFTAIVSIVGMVLLFVLNRKNSSPVLAA